MKYLLATFRNGGSLAWGFALAFLLASATVSAQGVLSGAQTGTIEAESQDDGYLIITGRRYKFSDGESLVFLNGEQVGAEVLDEGMVVRYTLRGGMLSRIEILGPINLLPKLDDS